MTTSDQMLEEPARTLPTTQRPETSTRAADNNTLRSLGEGLRALLGFLLRPLELFRTYNLGSLQPDIIAGLTVAVVTLPQAMAYAFVAELPPEIGLYAGRSDSTPPSSALPWRPFGVPHTTFRPARRTPRHCWCCRLCWQ